MNKKQTVAFRLDSDQIDQLKELSDFTSENYSELFRRLLQNAHQIHHSNLIDAERYAYLENDEVNFD